MNSILSGTIKATQIYGKSEMIITIIICTMFLILSIFGIIYVNTIFEKNYKVLKASIINNPVCTTNTDSKGNKFITGTMPVNFTFNGKEYKETVNTGSKCYNYTKDSQVTIKFDPNNIPGTVILASTDPKGLFNIILIIILIVCIIAIIINYVLINNKVAQTLSGASGISSGLKSLF
jgi:flagellar basal body-associated protein FliL